MLGGAGHMQDDQPGPAPGRRHVQQLENAVQALIGPAELEHFKAEELQRIGAEGRGQIAGQRRQQQEGVERVVRQVGQLRFPAGDGERWRRLPAAPGEADGEQQQDEQAKRLVQAVGRRALGALGQIDHRPAAPEQPADDERHPPMQEDGGQGVAGAVHRMLTPQGSSPTSISLSFLKLAVSITETLFERPLAT